MGIKKLLLGPLLRVNCSDGGEDAQGEIELRGNGPWRLLQIEQCRGGRLQGWKSALKFHHSPLVRRFVDSDIKPSLNTGTLRRKSIFQIRRGLSRVCSR